MTLPIMFIAVVQTNSSQIQSRHVGTSSL